MPNWNFTTPDFYENFYDTDALNWFSIDPSMTDVEKWSYYNFITNLKKDNVWDKLYAIYPFHGATSTLANRNLKDPTGATLSFFGGPTFSDTAGMIVNGGATQYALTPFRMDGTGPSSFGITLDSVFACCYAEGLTASSYNPIGVMENTPNERRISVNITTGTIFTDVYSTAFGEGRWSPGESNRRDFFLAVGRFGNDGLPTDGYCMIGPTCYTSGSNTSVLADTSTSTLREFGFGAMNRGGTAFGPLTGSIGFGAIGKGLNVAEAIIVYQRTSELMRSIGRINVLPGVFFNGTS